MSQKLFEQVSAVIGGYATPMVVAFSGGVDSTVVARVATMTHGREAVRCILARSESNTDDDTALCEALARRHDLAFEVVEYSELAIANYAENPANRCYFCKSELYRRLDAIAAAGGGATVLDGSNVDDGADYRPGMQAVREHGVRSPLREAGLRKAAVRELAAYLGLENHDRPAAPCLSSRIPYGQPITREKLDQVARAERFLRATGLREFRCRHHGDVARIEVGPEDMAVVVAHREAIVRELRAIGFTWVALDLAGFLSGSLNAALSKPGPTLHGQLSDNGPSP